MSTKTIKQRIALVAVSALTAGLFTVVSAPVANATNTAAAPSGYGAASTLVIGTNADTDGTPNLPTSTQAGAAVAVPLTSEDKINLDKLRVMSNRQVADEKLEQTDDLTKLKVGVDLAKQGMKNTQIITS